MLRSHDTLQLKRFRPIFWNSICFMWFWLGLEILRLVYKKAAFKMLNRFNKFFGDLKNISKNVFFGKKLTALLGMCSLLKSVSIATLPPFGPIEGQKWFDKISNQWESQKNRFAFSSFGKKNCFYLPVFEISRSCRTASAQNCNTYKHFQRRNKFFRGMITFHRKEQFHAELFNTFWITTVLES